MIQDNEFSKLQNHWTYNHNNHWTLIACGFFMEMRLQAEPGKKSKEGSKREASWGFPTVYYTFKNLVVFMLYITFSVKVLNLFKRRNGILLPTYITTIKNQHTNTMYVLYFEISTGAILWALISQNICSGVRQFKSAVSRYYECGNSCCSNSWQKFAHRCGT